MSKTSKGTPQITRTERVKITSTSANFEASIETETGSSTIVISSIAGGLHSRQLFHLVTHGRESLDELVACLTDLRDVIDKEGLAL